ncbi:similar to Saccharomyces cerevisiae YER106W MAM1 Monopolin, kinetochore associated protein involved in chromosome attachment to meiotic spindle [Maudiozyma saulgeensis]|uniref:Similar to Saccharomyces cerevisiae YER106W MAM1 Monopolin, kinetochore associated protein involved in chromosome attachment to meiotic spindle n=1 Tax=Maudiozyma saulgeensis TaxID=1789683 RepID=A0A1X7QXR6_9SACH|nr:similar to Saccharomyces cerevisiae YER106W MAM1 Monopolin, kinetochore associated protein involved in chromosome attachment to meiotic spindle [Kazachstania saulgeensis]
MMLERRVLSEKDINSQVPLQRRTLQNKKSLIQSKEKSIFKGNDTPQLSTKDNSDEVEAKRLNALQNSSPNSIKNIDISRPLTKANLKILQNQIFRYENMDPICNHYSCSKENMLSISCSRIWFLFELELTIDGKWNFRNNCYHNKVYKKIHPLWKIQNCLEKKLNDNSVKFDMSYITFIPLPNLSELLSNSGTHDSSAVELHVESLEEQVSSQRKLKKRKIMPPSILSYRNREKVFDGVTFDIEKILNDDIYCDPLEIDGNKYNEVLTPRKNFDSGVQHNTYFNHNK